MKQKEEASGIYFESIVTILTETIKIFPPDIFFQKKERRKHSLNRNFYFDYIGLEHK